MINGNMIGIGSAPLKTLILEDENGNTITGVCVENLTVFDATVNDVREGKAFVSDEGHLVGEKFIPPYYTTEGYKIITAGSEFKISLPTLDAYNYTKLQCVICSFNTSLTDSVAVKKTVINDNVYDVGSTVPLATITKNSTDKTVELGISNEESTLCIIRYFTYKEDL